MVHTPTLSGWPPIFTDRKSTRLNSSHSQISYAVFCLKKKKRCIEIVLVLFIPSSASCPVDGPKCKAGCTTLPSVSRLSPVHCVRLPVVGAARKQSSFG